MHHLRILTKKKFNSSNLIVATTERICVKNPNTVKILNLKRSWVLSFLWYVEICVNKIYDFKTYLYQLKGCSLYLELLKRNFIAKWQIMHIWIDMFFDGKNWKVLLSLSLFHAGLLWRLDFILLFGITLFYR